MASESRGASEFALSPEALAAKCDAPIAAGLVTDADRWITLLNAEIRDRFAQAGRAP
jgi:hypothetical protein